MITLEQKKMWFVRRECDGGYPEDALCDDISDPDIQFALGLIRISQIVIENDEIKCQAGATAELNIEMARTAICVKMKMSEDEQERAFE